MTPFGSLWLQRWCHEPPAREGAYLCYHALVESLANGAAVVRQPPVIATAVALGHLDGLSLQLSLTGVLPTAPACTKTLGSPQKFVC